MQAPRHHPSPTPSSTPPSPSPPIRPSSAPRQRNRHASVVVSSPRPGSRAPAIARESSAAPDNPSAHPERLLYTPNKIARKNVMNVLKSVRIGFGRSRDLGGVLRRLNGRTSEPVSPGPDVAGQPGRQGLVVGELGVEQWRPLEFGGPGLAGAAVEQVAPGLPEVVDAEDVVPAPSAVGVAVGVPAAEAVEVVRGPEASWADPCR